MWKDPIVEEIQKIRESHAKKFNYDMSAIYEDLKAKELKSEWKIVTLPSSNHDQPSEK